MASREEYNACITPYMTGKGKTREERQRTMCIGAKLCTKKAATEEEADKICQEAPSKPIKSATVKRGTKKCFTQVEPITSCLLGKIETIDLSKVKLSDILGDMVSVCLCGSKPKITRAKKAEKEYEAMTEDQKAALQTIAEVKDYYGTG